MATFLTTTVVFALALVLLAAGLLLGGCPFAGRCDRMVACDQCVLRRAHRRPDEP